MRGAFAREEQRLAQGLFVRAYPRWLGQRERRGELRLERLPKRSPMKFDSTSSGAAMSPAETSTTPPRMIGSRSSTESLAPVGHGDKQVPQSRNASAILQLRAHGLDAEADRLERLG
jgi:hypothetical protein